MAETTTPLVNNQTNLNPFIQGFADVAGAIGGIANQAVDVYSTFVGAKTTAKLAKAQAAGYQYQPTNTELDGIAGIRRTNFLVYAGVGVALIGTLALIYKAVK